MDFKIKALFSEQEIIVYQENDDREEVAPYYKTTLAFFEKYDTTLLTEEVDEKYIENILEKIRISNEEYVFTDPHITYPDKFTEQWDKSNFK